MLWWVAGPAVGLVVTLFAWLLGKSGIVFGTYAFARLWSAGAPADLARGAHPASS